MRVRVPALRVLAFRAFGTASIILAFALSGGVAADAPVPTAQAPKCEAAAQSAPAGKAEAGKAPAGEARAGEARAANGVGAPGCSAERVAEKRPSFADLLEGRDVVPLNTRGYNYKRPDEIRGEVPSRDSVPPPGVPTRQQPGPAPSDGR